MAAALAAALTTVDAGHATTADHATTAGRLTAAALAVTDDANAAAALAAVPAAAAGAAAAPAVIPSGFLALTAGAALAAGLAEALAGTTAARGDVADTQNEIHKNAPLAMASGASFHQSKKPTHMIYHFFASLMRTYLCTLLGLLVLRDCISNCLSDETKGVSFEKP